MSLMSYGSGKPETAKGKANARPDSSRKASDWNLHISSLTTPSSRADSKATTLPHSWKKDARGQSTASTKPVKRLCNPAQHFRSVTPSSERLA